ncbi:hypothetical protein [Pseudomonas baetica]|uniref:hypothetical protein n=1 Tax=Pseudomonas baetica TaxID=674054 RepID=UPI00240544EA|nr:hypothetical protein [Pseudomonas baetica]MDF9778765.1 hypothetical protein [Pseudomonas baetica]
MNPSSMTTSIQGNSRKYEQELRAAERQLSNAHERTLSLETDILSGLREISSVQLGSSTTLPIDVTRQLSVRKSEEAGLRHELGLVEKAISDHMERAGTLLKLVTDTRTGVFQALSVDSGYIQLLKARDTDRDAFNAYKSVHGEIESECQQKLKAFEQAPMFMYLINAKYGTNDYKGRFLVRFMDHWLAARINFQGNFISYQTLVAMKDATTVRLSELEDAMDTSDEMLTDAVKRSQNAAGVDHHQTELAEVQDRIKGYKARANSIHKLLGGFALKTDQHFQIAEQMMLGSLKMKSREELQRLVRTTTSNVDDEIARRISSLQEQLVAHHATIPALEASRQIAANNYERAKDLERTLRSSDYTNSNYRYRDDLDFDSLVLGYMAGQYSRAGVADEVQSYREEIPRSQSSGGFGYDSPGIGSSILDSAASVVSDVADFVTTDSF